MAARRVLSVGQCFADHSAISRTLQTQFGVEVVPADDAAEALARRLDAADLPLRAADVIVIFSTRRVRITARYQH